jgi:hypothetical protein
LDAPYRASLPPASVEGPVARPLVDRGLRGGQDLPELVAHSVADRRVPADRVQRHSSVRTSPETILHLMRVKLAYRGWLNPAGALWDMADMVTVKSPMLFPVQDAKLDLKLFGVTPVPSRPSSARRNVSQFFQCLTFEADLMGIDGRDSRQKQSC